MGPRFENSLTMSSTKLIDFRDSAAFKAAISDPSLGRVVGIHPFDPSPAITGVDKPTVVVSIASDVKRQTVEVYRQFVLLFQNSYLLSFADNLGLAWLYHNHVAPIDIDAFGFGFAKKFAAEQLHVLRPSPIARVLFLEAVMAYEPAWREPILEKQSNEALSRSSMMLTRIAADYMLHHEMGHISEHDHRFDQFVKPVVAAHLEESELNDLSTNQRALLIEEAEADIFGINCCLARYAPYMAADELRDYLTFAVRSIVVMNLVYAFADDIHRVNVDSEHGMSEINHTLLQWQHREKIAVSHIAHIDFDDIGIVTGRQSDLLSLPSADEIFASATRGEDISGIQDDNMRRMALVINDGFENGGNFNAVINGMRQNWLLEGDSLIHTKNEKDR